EVGGGGGGSPFDRLGIISQSAQDRRRLPAQASGQIGVVGGGLSSQIVDQGPHDATHPGRETVQVVVGDHVVVDRSQDPEYQLPDRLLLLARVGGDQIQHRGHLDLAHLGEGEHVVQERV